MPDEYPGVYAPEDAADFVAGRFEPGMVLCAESLIAEEGGREAVQLETQVLVTERGRGGSRPATSGSAPARRPRRRPDAGRSRSAPSRFATRHARSPGR